MGQLHDPRWVRIVVLGGALAIAAFGAVGLLLACMGLFIPVLWIGFGVLAFMGLASLARPLFRAEGTPNQAAKVGAGGAAAIALVNMFWNGVNAAKHVQINRDGAVYLNAGKWIAREGTLSVTPFVGPFTARAQFIGTSIGMSQHGGHLEFDLSHLLSAILAEAQNLGGNRLMFLTVPILSGFALLAFYLLAARLLRHPFAALAATATLAVVMPQVSFSRDSTSEIPMQLLLFTAIWLLCDRRTLRSRGTGFCVGLLLGLVQALHGDGLMFLLGLPVIFAVLWLRSRHADRQHLRQGFVGCGLGIAVGLVVAGFDLILWSHSYLSRIKGSAALVTVVGALIAAGSLAVVRFAGRPDLVDAARRRRERAAKVAAVLVLVFGLAAWFVRPLVLQVHGSPSSTIAILQRLNHVAIHPTRRYAELSVEWISWYLGPITLFIGIVAAAALVFVFVRGTLRVAPMTTALMLAPPALVYIWRPGITPDQVWAARRFLPAVFPGLILLTFALLCVAARDRSRPFLAERRFGVVVLAVLTAAFPLFTIRNVTQMTEQRGLFPVITAACRTIGSNGAVVMLEEAQQPKSLAYLADPQTLRSFCDVPVVVMLGKPQPAALQLLASQWSTEGRRLVVVSEFARTIKQVFPKAVVQPTLFADEQHQLDATLLHRPGRYTSDPRHETATPQLMIAAVPFAGSH